MIKCKLGELLKIKHGYAFKSENYVDKSQFALVTLANISETNNFKFNYEKTTFYGADFPNEFILKPGDLIMPLTEQVIGLIGNSAFVPEMNNFTFVLNQRVGKVIWDENKVNKYYLHYLLATQLVKEQLEYRASGTKQRNISPENVYDVTVYIPELEIQNKIGNTLYSIESKINSNNKIISELEAMAKTIYDYWFLQYEFPNEEGKPYKSNGGKMIYNEMLKREIPENWQVKNIMSFIKWEGTSQPPKACFIYEPKEGYIRFIQNRDYEDNSHLTFIPKNKALGICDKYDILIDKYGDAGKTRFGLEGAYNVALAKINVKNELYKEYIRNVLSSDAVYTYLHNSSMASTRASLNENNISYINIVVPNNETLTKFNKLANNYIETTLKVKAENEELTRLRDELLPLLMNGQVSFKN